ncbi:hypothetical protein Tco_0247867 [Tanacetum coccineum]
MAAPGAGNQVTRRVMDDLIDFNDETSIQGYMKFFKAQQIAETRRFGEVFDTLMGLRDARRVENTKLMGLNDLDTQAEEEIEMKEAQDVFMVYGYVKYESCMDILLVNPNESCMLDCLFSVQRLVMMPVMRILTNWMFMLPLGFWRSWVSSSVGGILRKPTSLKAIDIECVVESLPKYNVSGTVLDFHVCVLYH